MGYFDPDQPTTRAHEWNLTFEREFLDNTVVRIGYVGTHGARLDQYYTYNQAPNNYIWYVTTGLPLPTGTYAGVANAAVREHRFTANIERVPEDGLVERQRLPAGGAAALRQGHRRSSCSTS